MRSIIATQIILLKKKIASPKILQEINYRKKKKGVCSASVRADVISLTAGARLRSGRRALARPGRRARTLPHNLTLTFWKKYRHIKHHLIPN